jgi:hypothetical protein
MKYKVSFILNIVTFEFSFSTYIQLPCVQISDDMTFIIYAADGGAGGGGVLSQWPSPKITVWKKWILLHNC